MKKTNLFAVSLFAAALVVGAFAVGSGTQAQATPVTCSVNTGVIVVGSPVTLTASGGNGTYTWTSPKVALSNPTTTSTTFALSFNVPGDYPMTVTSGGTSATCNVIVAATEAPSNGGVEAPAPGLPNTGELPA